jgi:DnaK suppressor protein
MKTTDAIRMDLAWTRDQLARRLQRLREDLLHRRGPLSADSADRAQETQNDEVLEHLGHSTTALIDQYQHAIERLDAGRYAICEVCSYPIEPERLEVLPQATDCASCAEDRSRAH